MLATRHRLVKQADFRRVYRIGRLYGTGTVIVKVAANAKSFSRIGFSVEKKQFAKATDRNRVKRLLRESIRPVLAKIKPGFDLVIICRRPNRLEELEFKNLQTAIAAQLQKGHLFIA
ncbi:ribonuclease P protein component [Patescibacteria group bacterium]|nr:MAG: ribonuclease P protein component [Patescibacteria group bacterium]